MLQSLHIENIAVIKSVDLDLSSEFTAFTGETGAGKSIILDSINLLMGAKADRELIRHGETGAMVSALFTDLSAVTKKKCEELGISLGDEQELLVQRTITLDGKSQVRINGRAVNLSILKQLSSNLVSIHGQNDTGELINAEKHIEILDIYSSNDTLLEEYRGLYRELEAIRKDIQDIEKKESERERLKAVLEYQINDIDELKLHDGEEDELIDKKVKIKNSEKIIKNSEFVYKALRGSEKGSVAFLIDRSITALNQLSSVIPEYAEYAERLTEALTNVEDIAEEVYSVIDDAETDPTAVLNEIESRLDKISKIKRKYGLTLSAVLEFRDKAKEELDTLENLDSMLDKLMKKEAEAYNKAVAHADALHKSRIAASDEMSKRVCDILRFLDMPNIVFYANSDIESSGDKKVLNKDGYDKIEFYISANKGAEAQSLSKIASGGELARVMLAIKSIIADNDGVSTVIFDEVDTGVSGKTARKIGLKMRDMSDKLQVVSVTHSAQIASLADSHLLIRKDVVGGATETSVISLDREGRIKELSRILGGINVTEAQRAAAVDMLNERLI